MTDEYPHPIVARSMEITPHVMRNKVIFGLIAVAVVVGGAWWFAPKEVVSSTEVAKVRIANLPVVQALPLYLAIEKGYFAQEGIAVEVVPFEAPNQIIDAIMAGQVDFTSPSGAMGITGIADFKNPGKLKIYGVAGGDDVVANDAILVRVDSTIATIKELKGKKLGILPGIQWRTIARHILTQSNLVADQDVVLVELAANLQAPALAAGQIDALLAIEPMPTIVKAKNIGKEIVHVPTVRAIANPFYGGAGAVRVEFARQNPHTTEKVLAVLGKAMEEIRQDPESARHYLKGYTPLTDDLLTQAPVLRFKMAGELSLQEIAAVQTFYDLFSTYKVIDGHMDFKNLLYAN